MKKLLIIILFIPMISLQSQDFSWDGTFDVVGSDTLLMNDSDYKVINYGYSLDSAFLNCKTKGMLVLYETDTIPLTNLWYENYNDADTLWFQFSEREVDSEDMEVRPYRVTDIRHYTTPTSSVFSVPFEISGTMTTVCPSGCDATNVSDGISLSGTNDTIVVYTGNYDEVNWVFWRDQNIAGIGDCYVTSQGVSAVVLTRNETDVFMNGFELDGEGNTDIVYSASSVYNNKHMSNCYLTGGLNDIARFITTSTQTQDNSFDKCVFKAAGKEIDIQTDMTFRNCLFIEAPFNTKTSVSDTIRIDYSTHIFNDYTSSYINMGSLSPNYCYVNYNTFEDIEASRVVNVLAATSKQKLEFIGNTITSDSIQNAVVEFGDINHVTVSNNTFTNETGTSISNIVTTEFDSLYVRDNTFRTLSGNAYPMSISSTSLASVLYIQGNNDSTIINDLYYISVGTENTGATDNQIQKTVITDNIGYGNNSTSHGIFCGFQSGDLTISHNNINSYGINYVIKGSTGTNSADFKIWANLSVNSGSSGFRSKGVDSLNFYHCTSYNDSIAFYFTENTGSDGATNCEVKNSIVETRTGGYAYQHDVNSSTGFDGNYNVVYSDNIAYYNGTLYTWSTWQGLGQDLNSYNSDPLFQSSTELWPTEGSDALGNGTNLGYNYSFVLSKYSTWQPNSIILAKQNNPWDIGTYRITYKTVRYQGKTVRYQGKTVKY